MTVSRGLGRVLRGPASVRLEFRRSWPGVGVGDLWSALTDPDRLAVWFGRWSGDPASGRGEIHLTAEGNATPELVRISACDPPTRLAVSLGSPDGPWPLELSLASDGDGSSLLFVHHLAEPYDARSIGSGWHFYLDRLSAVVNGTEVPEDFSAYDPAPPGAYELPPAPRRAALATTRRGRSGLPPGGQSLSAPSRSTGSAR